MTARKYTPLFLLFVLLSVFGIAIYRHALLSTHPPFWDAFSYVQKAKNFWTAVDARKWFNPLDLEPTVRAPGTVLMSYPLGFSQNFQDFYFRSIFIPLLLFVAGLWVITGPYCRDTRTSWMRVWVCLAFATLPLFYHFEHSERIPSTSFWGMVDCYLAGMSALACALLVRGVSDRSLSYTMVGIVASGFCLWIKPAAMVLMAVNLMTWIVCAASQFLQKNKQPSCAKALPIFWYCLLSLIFFCVIYSTVFYLSMKSSYLSQENWNVGRRSMELLHKEWFIENWFPLFKIQMHTSLGWHWSMVLLAVCLLTIGTKNISVTFPDIALSVGIFCAGLWFWFVPTGQSQTRYFYPFILISVTLCIPRTLLYFSRLHEKFAKAITFALVGPFLLLLCLLVPADAPPMLQKIMGVNLTSGSLKEECKQAQAIIKKSRVQQREPKVYLFWPDYLHGVFYGAAQYAKLIEPQLPAFTPMNAVNWVNDSVLRFSDIAACDYLVFAPLQDPAAQDEAVRQKEVSSFFSEVQLMRAVLSKYPQSMGLEIVSKNALAVARVADAQRFLEFLEQLRSEHRWRDIFNEANGPSRQAALLDVGVE